MKNIFKFRWHIPAGMLFLILFLCASILSVSAQVSSSTERIKSFDATAIVESNRMLTVTEKIVYDFGNASKHGIYRTIPEKYSRNGGSYRLRFNVKDVWMDGKAVAYSITSRTPNLTIRIGDADKMITGIHEYQIVYQTDQAINFFNDHDELYWNVTGNSWEVPIESASISVKGPDGFDAVTAKDDCFVGSYGSSSRECEIRTQSLTVWFQSKRSLGSSEGMTVVLSFPKSLIKAPTWMDTVMRFIKDNWIVVLPFIVFFFMYRAWDRDGREPKGRGTIIPQYEPPRGFTPMEMDVLMNQSNQPKAITATIIDLARRGYLKIIYSEKKGLLGIGGGQSYSFEKMKEIDEKLLTHETVLLNGMFKDGENNVDMDDLKGKYYQSISKAQNSIYGLLRKSNYFGKNPISVRASWIGVASAIGVVGVFLPAVFQLGAVWTVSIVLSAGIVGIFGWFMPKKTEEGAIALEEVEGFKWFLSVTEKDRLAFHNAPTLKPEQFHEYLSYAIVFGVEDQWANQFKDMMVPEPSYVSGYGYTNPILFAHAMYGFGGDFAKSFTPPSSAGSGGSGFSGGGVGGGFGGGGGGSW